MIYLRWQKRMYKMKISILYATCSSRLIVTFMATRIRTLCGRGPVSWFSRRRPSIYAERGRQLLAERTSCHGRRLAVSACLPCL